MKNSFKKSLMFLMLLLALTFSALGVTPALADDGVTQPADAPVVEQPVADTPVVDAPAATVEEPATEEVAATVSEVLEALPEGTDLVVQNESGEALPLASQEAAEAVASAADPYFYDINGEKYSYMFPGQCGTTPNCTESDTPIQAAVYAFRDNQNATGEIFILAGTYNEDVYITGYSGNLANLTGLIGASSGSTTINGLLDAYSLPNAFTLSGFTFTNSVLINSDSDVVVDNVVVDGSYMGIYSGGNVELNGVTVSQSPYEVGAYISADGDISIWNSHFDDNADYGLYVYSNSGNVMLDGVTASGNEWEGAYVEAEGDISIWDSAFNDNGYNGLYARSYSGNVMLDGVTASGNGDTGAFLDASVVEVFCSEFSGNDVGLQGGKSGPDLYLNGVTFSGNASGDYFNNGNVWVGDCGKAAQAVEKPADDGVDKKEQTSAQLYIVVEQVQGQLPAALGEGFKFGSALKVELTNEGRELNDLAITLSFPIPDGMKDAALSVMFWNGSAWVEVSGGSVVDGFYVITVDQPGNYVLVTK
jgi:hypothetical protein